VTVAGSYIGYDYETQVRMVVYHSEGAAFTIDVYGAAGRRQRSVPVPLFPGVPDYYNTVTVRGKLVLVNGELTDGTPTVALMPLGDPLRPRDLPGDGFGYGFVTDDLLADPGAGHLARIDPDTGEVLRVVDTEPFQYATPYAGGIILGLGRAVYDHHLNLVADNPGAEEPMSYVVAHGNRLYARTFTCFPYSTGAVIADAGTGAILARPAGDRSFGVLGAYVSAPNSDDCD
jgi:hypothetical protein